MTVFSSIPFIGFLALAFLIGAKMMVLRKRKIQHTAQSKKTAFTGCLLYPVFMVIFLLFLYELIKTAFHISYSPLPPLLLKALLNSAIFQVVGSLLLGFALLLMYLTLRDFADSFRFGYSRVNKGVLLTSGLFAYTRNPFFISIGLYFWACAFLLPNLFFSLLALLATIGIHLFILKEEKFLFENYGEEYKRYTQKVRRYF